MTESEIILDDLEYVCRDNFREIRDNKGCYIYRKAVLNRTIELCEEKNLNYKVASCEDYYAITGYGNHKEKKRRK